MSDQWPAPGSDVHLIGRPADGLTDDEVLRKARATVRELLIGEIRRAIEHQIGIASLILSMCAIDLLGTLYTGKAAGHDTFTTFLERYLPAYPSKRMKSLRDALLHTYLMPLNIGYAIDRRVASRHLRPAREGSDVLLLVGPVLVDDLDRAAEQLFLDARAEDGPVRRHVLARAKRVGLMLIADASL